MKPIFLTGYMASGKTTLGRALARKLDFRFIDIDFFIEQRFRQPVAALFAERGEEWFRKIETNVLREIGEQNDVVISCGGGTPCFAGNMEFMNRFGITVWVDAPVSCIVRRLLVAKVRRPLVIGKSPDELADHVARHLNSRLPFYSQASIRFQGDQLENRREIDQSVESLISILRKTNP